MDVPGGRARIRLESAGRGAWDATIDGRRLTVSAADSDSEPDALLRAEAGTWRAIASDIRAGMRAFATGRLHVRRSLHLGVGFLAATSGATEEGRLSFETLPTGVGRIS